MSFSGLFSSSSNTNETRWAVQPFPNQLSEMGVKALPLRNSDSLFFSMDGVWMYPGKFDRDRIMHGVTMAMRDFPHGGGRLVHKSKWDEANGESEWMIDCTPNQGIPVTFGVTDRKIDLFDPRFSHEKESDICDPLPLPLRKNAFVGVPLIRIKVVYWTNLKQTSIHQSWFHGLGDGFTGGGMMFAMSEYYQGREPDFRPSYDQYLDPRSIVPSDAAARGHALGLEPLLAHIPAGACSVFTLVQSMWSSKRNTIPVEMTITAPQVRAAQAIVMAETGEKSCSPSLAVSAYLLHTLNSVSGKKPIRKFQQILGTRQFPAENQPEDFLPPGPTSAGNAIVMISGVVPQEKPSVAEIAAAIRKSAITIRDPEKLIGILGLRVEMFYEYLKKTGSMFYLPRDEWIGLNNQTKINWMEADFGHVGQTRFYLFDTTSEGVFTFFAPNPIIRPDGRWEILEEGAMEVKFRLQKAWAKAFLNKVELDLGDQRGAVRARL